MKKFLSLALLVGVLVAAASVGQAAPRALLSDNLVAYWKMDEASGTRNDSAGTSHLTDNNTVTSAAGVLGSSAQFASANFEYLSVADNAALSMGGTQDFTLAGWVYFDSVTFFPYVVDKGTTNNNREYQLYLDSGKLLFLVGNGSSFNYVLSSQTLTQSTWYFVAGRHDATNDKITVTVNSGHTAATWAGGSNDNAHALTVGGTGGHLSGRVDELSIYKRVLSDSELSTLYNSGAGCAYEYLDTGCAAPTPTPTNTSTPGPTNTPTSTPVPTNTPTPTPLPTSTPVGEYQVVLSNGDVAVVENRFTTADVVEILLLAAIAGGDILWRARQQSRGLK